MNDKKNNNNNFTYNQIDVTQAVTQDVNIQKLTGETLNNFINEHNFSGFTIMSNATINLLNYDCALAVYCYLACKPNDWKICVENIKNHFNISKPKAYKIFDYLMEVGLLERKVIRENGKHKTTVYFLYVTPKKHNNEKLKAENLIAEKIPTTKKRINKENIINEKENNNFVITKEIENTEIEETIVKAQECLENTKSNLPISTGSLKPVVYQDVNYLQPIKPNTKLTEYVKSCNPFNLPDETIEGFLEMRKIKKNPVTPHSWKLLQSSLQKCVEAGYTAQECLETAIVHGWSGIQKEWMDRTKGKFANPNQLDHNSLAWADGFNSPFYNLDGVSKNE